MYHLQDMDHPATKVREGRNLCCTFDMARSCVLWLGFAPQLATDDAIQLMRGFNCLTKQNGKSTRKNVL